MQQGHLGIEEICDHPIAKHMLAGYLNSHPPVLMVFHGPPGVGKFSTAEAFIYQFLCNAGNGCGNCSSCRQLLANEHPDYIRFPNQPIYIGEPKDPQVFSIRWLLQTRLPYSPFHSRTRFVVFTQAENIQHEAETALLKTLEESPEHNRFILLTNNLEKLKATIVSRGICIPFGFLSQDNIKKITGIDNPMELSCLGGSLQNAPLIKSKFYPEIKTRINQAFSHPVELVALENWLLEFKDQATIVRMIDIEIDYVQLLDFFGTVLLVLAKNLDRYKEISQAIFQFKQDLHLNMAGLPVYLLSRLFVQIQALHFQNA